jgi:hypothetical protein
MKRIILLAAFVVAFSVNLQAQGTPSQEEMMKSWKAYMTPGEVHKMLSKSNGVWLEEVTMWMDPSAPPTKSKAKATNKMILGGRYQESKHIGTMDGMPFEGCSTLGYDNAKKVFQSTWIDNMGTGTMFMEGTWDEATKTIHFKGKCVEPMSGQDMMVREEFTIIDDNNQKLEMYMTMPGQPEMKSMEITLKRMVKVPLKK